MTTMMKFEFLTDAVMYHGSVRVGDVELFFNDDDYSVNCVGTNGMFPFVYSDSLCRYIALVYWDEFVRIARCILDELFSRGLDYTYTLDDIDIRFVGWEVYVEDEILRKPSGIPGVEVGSDIYDVEFVIEELYTALGFGGVLGVIMGCASVLMATNKNENMEVQR